MLLFARRTEWSIALLRVMGGFWSQRPCPGRLCFCFSSQLPTSPMNLSSRKAPMNSGFSWVQQQADYHILGPHPTPVPGWPSADLDFRSPATWPAPGLLQCQMTSLGPNLQISPCGLRLQDHPRSRLIPVSPESRLAPTKTGFWSSI